MHSRLYKANEIIEGRDAHVMMGKYLHEELFFTNFAK
jgi:hypothetical protein